MEPIRFDDVEVSLNRDNAPCDNMEQLTDEVERHADTEPKLE